MTTGPTIEQFFTQPDDHGPEEPEPTPASVEEYAQAVDEKVERHLQEYDPHTPPTPPTTELALGSIATSLRMIADLVVRRDREEEQHDDQAALVNELDRELQQARQQLEEIRETVKKSTSKLADAVRAVLDRPSQPASETTAPEQRVVHRAAPAPDAPVEEWRAFAQEYGGGAITGDLQQMNRSQIRTALGIEHGGESS